MKYIYLLLIILIEAITIGNLFSQKLGEFEGGIKIGNDTTAIPDEGVLRFTGTEIEAFVEGEWQPLTGKNTSDSDWVVTPTSVYNISKEIGIGTINPMQPLVINGPANDGTKTSLEIFNVLSSVPVENSKHLHLDGQGMDVFGMGLVDHSMQLQKISSGDIDMVTGGGHVGVGTSAAPTRRMMVSGTEIPANEPISETEATFSILNTDQDGFSEMIFDGNQIETVDEDLRLNLVSDKNVTLVEGGGNVGIGIDQPLHKLHLHSSSDNFLYFNKPGLGTSPYADGARVGLDGATNLVVWNSEDQGIVFGTNSAHRMSIGKDGRVAIGSLNNPATGYLLSVNGDIIAEEVRVQLAAAWPDYVFEKGYDLLSLEEVQHVIDEKGHLPGIPSASEIDEEGLDVGDMQVKMMEKIEELTLHIIALNERIKHLESH